LPTTTTNFGLSKPLVNNATDQDLWGGYLNTDLDNVDTLLLTALDWTPSSKTTSFSVTAPTSGSTTTGSAKTLYLSNATGGAITVSLPATSTASGLHIAIKKTDSSANAVTITANGVETIDGSNTLALSTQYAYAVLACDGTGWDILAQTAPSVNYATKADMQTATSTTTVVNPAQTQNHPGVAKATVNVTVSGTTPTVQAQFNVTSVTRTSSGLYRVTFTTNFTDTKYRPIVFGSLNTAGNFYTFGALVPSSKTTAHFDVQFSNLNNSVDDPSEFSIVVFGTQ
jgi:hypothetical protein